MCSCSGQDTTEYQNGHGEIKALIDFQFHFAEITPHVRIQWSALFLKTTKRLGKERKRKQGQIERGRETETETERQTDTQIHTNTQENKL